MILALILTFAVALRYLVIAGMFYFMFYILRIPRLERLRIENIRPSPKIIRQEIGWSLGTSVIFGVLGAWLFRAWELGLTRVYLDITEYGWGYYFLSIATALFIHDTYFYWMHRWVHHPKLFPWIHKVHHLSNPPTPWAAFSFHWTESILEALIFPAMVLVLPLHISAVAFLLVLMTITSVINHLGFEIYPRNMLNHPIGKYIVSASHHQLHHKKFRLNYGLYFTWWDHWMGTNENP